MSLVPTGVGRGGDVNVSHHFVVHFGPAGSQSVSDVAQPHIFGRTLDVRAETFRYQPTFGGGISGSSRRSMTSIQRSG